MLGPEVGEEGDRQPADALALVLADLAAIGLAIEMPSGRTEQAGEVDESAVSSANSWSGSNPAGPTSL
ncbi:MAG: hypothetical protein ACRDQ2_01455 [Gaiellales bacterium]